MSAVKHHHITDYELEGSNQDILNNDLFGCIYNVNELGVGRRRRCNATCCPQCPDRL